MANSAQARKRTRQNDRRRLRNASTHSAMRTRIKNFIKSLEEGDVKKAETAYQTATSEIDRIAKRGLEHPNKAARMKSRLNNRLRKLATAG